MIVNDDYILNAVDIEQDPSAPGRLGMDGLNEHVHNYFVTVYSRGGILQLLLFILLHISLIKIWKNNNANMKILIYYLPIIFVSCSACLMRVSAKTLV